MAIKFVIAVTDDNWFDTLRGSDLSEVNFWSPSAKNFQALEKGELFLFKLRKPRNYIVGAGIFAYANKLPWSLAWRVFGRANGAKTAQEMRADIAKYQGADANHRIDFTIGCRILTHTCFFREPDWIPVPASWSPNIVAYKTYNTGNFEGNQLWKDVNDRLQRQDSSEIVTLSSRYGEPCLYLPRLGQGAFRVLVTDNYERRCAVTQERTLPALEAAHIRPYGDGGKHEAQNGLLLRSDIHSLFDTGYVTVTPSLNFEVSRRIREEFENGKDYYALHGRPIAAPRRFLDHPDPHALAWHNEHCFRG